MVGFGGQQYLNCTMSSTVCTFLLVASVFFLLSPALHFTTVACGEQPASHAAEIFLVKLIHGSLPGCFHSFVFEVYKDMHAVVSYFNTSAPAIIWK